MSNCAYHPERDAVGACVDCGKLVCEECKTVLAAKIYCNPCIEKRFSSQLETGPVRAETGPVTAETGPVRVETGPVRAETGPVRAETGPVRAETGPVRAETGPVRAEATAFMGENTSGQGTSAVVPEAIKGWNWGAFFLSWIWGVGNSVWISLLAFVPPISVAMPFVLGVKGSEWAWQNKRWDSIEHFKKTQSTWTKWGIGIAIVGALITILCIILVVIIACVSESYYWY